MMRVVQIIINLFLWSEYVFVACLAVRVALCKSSYFAKSRLRRVVGGIDVVFVVSLTLNLCISV